MSAVSRRSTKSRPSQARRSERTASSVRIGTGSSGARGGRVRRSVDQALVGEPAKEPPERQIAIARGVRAPARDLIGDKRLDMLAADRGGIGRHAPFAEEPTEQVRRFGVDPLGLGREVLCLERQQE
jgi:hypothetical protein